MSLEKVLRVNFNIISLKKTPFPSHHPVVSTPPMVGKKMACLTRHDSPAREPRPKRTRLQGSSIPDMPAGQKLCLYGWQIDIAMENPIFRWYLPGILWDFHGAMLVSGRVSSCGSANRSRSMQLFLLFLWFIHVACDGSCCVDAWQYQMHMAAIHCHHVLPQTEIKCPSHQQCIEIKWTNHLIGIITGGGLLPSNCNKLGLTAHFTTFSNFLSIFKYDHTGIHGTGGTWRASRSPQLLYNETWLRGFA